jgi:hypothetical protein
MHFVYVVKGGLVDPCKIALYEVKIPDQKTF